MGLLKANEKFVERPGNNSKFIFTKEQLLEIIRMFKSELVEK
jgi:hypothetical protein